MTQKNRTVYKCSECGYESVKWIGKCPSCNSWNTLNEEIQYSIPDRLKTAAKTASAAEVGEIQKLTQITSDTKHRFKTDLNELNRVLGGGIVKGSLVLLGGDPGIGKSTMLLQICEYLGENDGLELLYVSGEESAHQIKLRPDRLGVKTQKLSVMQETDIHKIAGSIMSLKPQLVIIDSIQTMCLSDLSSSPGSVTQVRECTNYIMRTAKSLDIPVFLVGHVNKDGAIAGPKVMEHIVDAVLYFEGDRNQQYRILRAVKNRFGSTNEIGVFEMAYDGLKEVENPSLMLISGRPQNTSGTCVACVMEGSRPILAEVQGLVTRTGFGNPRRMVTGFDFNRMSMLIAVLEKRCGFYFSSNDAYINIVGGFRLDEPAADLPVVLALVSSLKDAVIADDVVVFGEVGLAGEVRSVSNCEKRVTEAYNLGFKTCILPKYNLKNLKNIPSDMEVFGVRSVREAIALIV